MSAAKSFKKTDRRRRIVAAALELFHRTHDVKKVTVEDIAAAAAVSPTTIYNQFGNRDALVIEAAKSLINEILENARTYLKSDLPFPAKLSGMITGKMELAASYNSEIVTRLMSQDSRIAPLLEDLYNNEARQLWRTMLEDGKQQGYIEESLDPEAFLTYMNAMRIGFAAQGELFKDWRTRMQLIEEITRLFFYGFLKKDIDLFGKEDNQAHG